VRIVTGFVGILTTLALIFALVANKPEPPGAATKPEAEAVFPNFVMKLPEGWKTRTEGGKTFAYKEPCSTSACNNVTVYGSDVLAGANWEAKITEGYSCVSHPAEKPGRVTPRNAQAIGNHDAQYFTLPLCGASNSELLAVWLVPLPPTLVVAHDWALV
jgi:hypothetical protein